jgi:hypothetical protein
MRARKEKYFSRRNIIRSYLTNDSSDQEQEKDVVAINWQPSYTRSKQQRKKKRETGILCFCF